MSVPGAPWVTYEHITRFAHMYLCDEDDDADDSGPWNQDPPEDDAAWQRLLITVMTDHFSDHSRLRRWIQDRLAVASEVYVGPSQHYEGDAAERMMQGAIEESLRHRARIDRSLDAALKRS